MNLHFYKQRFRLLKRFMAFFLLLSYNQPLKLGDYYTQMRCANSENIIYYAQTAKIKYEK